MNKIIIGIILLLGVSLVFAQKTFYTNDGSPYCVEEPNFLEYAQQNKCLQTFYTIDGSPYCVEEPTFLQKMDNDKYLRYKNE